MKKHPDFCTTFAVPNLGDLPTSQDQGRVCLSGNILGKMRTAATQPRANYLQCQHLRGPSSSARVTHNGVQGLRKVCFLLVTDLK